MVLLDHHKTAIEEYEGKIGLPENLDRQLDINLSGATIALRHFKPKVPFPVFLLYWSIQIS